MILLVRGLVIGRVSLMMRIVKGGCVVCGEEVYSKGLCRSHCNKEWYDKNIRKVRKEYKERIEVDFPKKDEIKDLRVWKSRGLKSKSSFMVCERCGKLTYKRGYNQKYCKDCRWY